MQLSCSPHVDPVMKQSRQKTSGLAFTIRQCCLTECVCLKVFVLNLVEQGLRAGALNYNRQVQSLGCQLFWCDPPPCLYPAF